MKPSVWPLRFSSAKLGWGEGQIKQLRAVLDAKTHLLPNSETNILRVTLHSSCLRRSRRRTISRTVWGNELFGTKKSRSTASSFQPRWWAATRPEWSEMLNCCYCITMFLGNWKAGSLHTKIALRATAPSTYTERTSVSTFLYQVVCSEGYLSRFT